MFTLAGRRFSGKTVSLAHRLFAVVQFSVEALAVSTCQDMPPGVYEFWVYSQLLGALGPISFSLFLVSCFGLFFALCGSVVFLGLFVLSPPSRAPSL